jgi:16S rRNA (uracil1498-N3)-methyltransferase
MRARPGDEIIVFGDNGQFAATLTGTTDRGIATLVVGDHVQGPPPSSVDMTFAVPWIKGGKTELLVQKLTELGASRIIAFQARREVVKGDDSKIDRLKRVALEACKQCERVDVPVIEIAPGLIAAIEACDEIPVGSRLMLHERQGHNLLGCLVLPALEVSQKIMIASGPEGGWHPEEVQAVANKIVVASLGQRILRAETAPIAAAAAVLTLAGEL